MDIRKKYQEYIKSKNLKSSNRRDIIFEHVLSQKGHFTIDEIYLKIANSDPTIGIATVYRTIKMLVDAKILIEQQFGEKKGIYEIIKEQFDSHGHLICKKCGKIIEIDIPEMENMKEIAARQHKFNITTFKVEFYGICQKCLKQ